MIGFLRFVAALAEKGAGMRPIVAAAAMTGSVPRKKINPAVPIRFRSKLNRRGFEQRGSHSRSLKTRLAWSARASEFRFPD
jgi:hypothetical protein